MFRSTLRILPVLLTVFLATNAGAQWYHDSTRNTAVCSLAGSQQDDPKICSDESDGAIIVWQDTRNAGTSNIYAQRLNAAGRPLWTPNGVRLAAPRTGTAQQLNPVVCSDGAGGAYVVWHDLRNQAKNGIDLYGQHIRGDGTLAGADTGIKVCDASQDQFNPVICADGRGGAFVVWGDNRATKTSYRPDLYMNRLSGAGVALGRYGVVVADSPSVQRNPAICNDGNGGCYIVYENGNTIPYSIYANHFDANGTPYWNSSRYQGYLIYRMQCGDCSTQDASHPAVSRDGEQLLVTWEVTSGNTQNGQNIMATRIRCASPADTIQVWGEPIEVTSEMLSDQIRPQIFSDGVQNSSGYKGILVPFEGLRLGPSTDDYDVNMIRVLGDGTTKLPAPMQSYDLVRQPHAQIGFQAVQADSCIIAVWNDARFYDNTQDTAIYAQVIDRSGNRHVPSVGTSSKWGEAICNGNWNTKQVALAPRTNGAIAVWTDYRHGASDADIYAQVIMQDGSLIPPSSANSPTTTVISRTGSFDTGTCNARCTNVLVVDSGGNTAPGIDSIVAASSSNFQLTTTTFVRGADSARFSLCVVDSMKDAFASVHIVNFASKVASFDLNYCTIHDTLPPVVQVDTIAGGFYFHVREKRSWDRGIGAITISDSTNVSITPPLSTIHSGALTADFQVKWTEPKIAGKFSIVAIDTANNSSSLLSFAHAIMGTRSVAPSEVSLLVYPNPLTSSAIVRIDGIDHADVLVFDVLGRPVDRFLVNGTYEWNPAKLTPGSYLIRTTVGATTLTKRVVVE